MAEYRSTRSSTHVPVRTCVGCRRRAARSHLIRVVVGEGQPPALRLDLRGRLPGRGAHLHPDVRCLDRAERRRAFGRALRLTGPVDLTEIREHLGGAAAQSTPLETDEPKET